MLISQKCCKKPSIMYLGLLLLLHQIIFAFDMLPNYDDDITIPIPVVVLNHSPTTEPALKSLGKFNNCSCRENPNNYIVCYGTTCESFPTNLKITTALFKLKITQISTIQRDDFLNLNEVIYLEIESNQKLVRIVPGAFRQMSHLRNLTISFNENLNYLEEHVFEGLTNLSTICVQKNGFIRVIDITKTLIFQHVPRLYLMDLSEQIFHEIGMDEFYPMKGTPLEQLNLILCEIEYIHPDALEPLKHLKSLRLGQNLFNASVITNLVNRCNDLGVPLANLNLYEMGLRKKIPLDLLEAVGRSNITFLHLTRNNIEHIDDQSFPFMPNLIQLSLRDNLILDITPNSLRKLTKLRSLYLGINRISTIPCGAMLDTLQEVDLAGNNYNGLSPNYFYIKNGIFQNMSQLENLLLSYNNIGSINKNTFVGLTNLTRLNLKNTSLYHIDPCSFVPLKNLMLLNLMNNPFPIFMPLIPEIFQGLDKLQVLLLGGCSIKNLTINPSLFLHTPNLIHLGLERNSLLTISSTQLIHLTKLHSLNIAENNLPPWNDHILPQTNLKILGANQNKFTHISIKMLEDWQYLESLYLDGNPLTCDCSLLPVITWLRNNKIHINYDENDEFIAKCVSPEKWRRKSIVEYMNNADKNKDCDNFYIHNQLILILSLVFLLLIIFSLILCYIYRWHVQYWMFILRLSLKKHNIWKMKSLLQTGDYKYDAFVSYCHDDHDFVMKMVDILENQEPYLKLCVYERDFQIGSLISASIVENVAVSKRTLLVISDAFAKSHWCRWETQLAEYHQIFFQNDSSYGPDDTLLMIRLENVSKVYMTPILKYLLKTRIYLQWDSDPGKQCLFWEKLRAKLASKKVSSK